MTLAKHGKAAPTARASGGESGRASASASNSLIRERLTAASPGRLPFRDEMEALFGADFSDVNVATGLGSQVTAMGAAAFTDGQQVVFADASPDKETVAHELAHVVQQGGSVGASGVSAPGDASEQEADTVAQQVTRGERVQVEEAAGAALHGDWMADLGAWASSAGHTVAEGLGLESSGEVNLGRAAAFVDHGHYGDEEVTPSTGRGGFRVGYDPGHEGVEHVSMNTKVEFKDLITFSGGVAVATEARWAPAAVTVNALPEVDRAAAAAGYMWTSDAKAAFLTDMQARVEGAWSRQHEFHVNRPQWDWIGATVDVDIAAAEGTRADGDHLAIKAYQMPPTESMSTYSQASFVNGGTSASNADQTGEFSVNDLNPRPDPTLRTRSVFFGNNDDALDATDTAFLDSFIRTFEGAPSDPRSHPTQVQVIGFSSARGRAADNQALAQRRADAVSAYLAANGWTNVAARVQVSSKGATESDATDPDNANDRRVDLIVDNNDRQIVVDHEFGHAFGLDDEYAVADSAGNAGLISGTGGNAGAAADHDAMVKRMTDADGVALPGAIAENNDGIMSLGNAVRPQHYAPFHEALCQVSGVGEWSLGPPPTTQAAATNAVQDGASSTPGDFPTPTPSDMGVA